MARPRPRFQDLGSENIYNETIDVTHGSCDDDSLWIGHDTRCGGLEPAESKRFARAETQRDP